METKKRGLPNWGEFVLCTSIRITPFAAWCKLDEYEADDGSAIEGMIHISEVAGKWVKDIRAFVKPNKQYVAKVVYIDYQKGHVNLSLKRVSKYDQKEKMENFRRGKRAVGMLMQIARIVGKNESDVQKEVAERLEKTFREKNPDGKFDLLSVLEETVENPDVLAEAGLAKEWSDATAEVVKKSFRVKEKTLKAILSLSSNAPDGVELIKKILSTLESVPGINVKYISAPKYRVDIKSKTPKEAERKLKEGLEVAAKEIKAAGGEGSYSLLK